MGIPLSDWFVQLYTKRQEKRRSKNAAKFVPIQCPCHENHKCNYRFFCNLCCDLFHKSELQFEQKQNMNYDPEPSLMCNPTDVLISFPFKTKN